MFSLTLQEIDRALGIQAPPRRSDSMSNVNYTLEVDRP